MENTYIEDRSDYQKKERGINLKQFLFLCLSNWQWFVISVIICLGLAFLYIKHTAPTYTRNALVMIRTNEKGTSMSANSAMLQDLGINNGNSPVDNEIAIIGSPDLMRDVVRRLRLNISYSTRKGIRTEDLYGSTLPVTVTMPDIPEEDNASFKLHLQSNGDFTITDLKLKKKTFERAPIHGRLGVPVSTPLGRITVNPAKGFEKMARDSKIDINVSRVSVRTAAKNYAASLKSTVDKKMRNVVELTWTGPSIEKATDILNTLIAAYNDTWMLDKREMANSSSDFIDERIQVLQKELGNVDHDISQFKSNNMLPDVTAAAQLYMTQASKGEEDLKQLENQAYMLRYVRNSLRDNKNGYKPLPSSLGVMDAPALTQQLVQYNTRVSERNSLASQSSENNPLLTTMDAELDASRHALLATMDNEIAAIQEQIKTQQNLMGHARSQIASNPNQARYLLSVERQQKVKEELYLFLLQKREENQLNQALSSSNTRMIRTTDGPDTPVAPRKAIILLLALVCGIAIPGGILYMKEANVSVVRNRKDISGLTIPFAGELPFDGKAKKSFSSAGRHKEMAVVAVKANSRNVINEAFRVIRTNLEFMRGRDTKPQVVMVTSASPGSGKTYITFNLAKSFSIKGKKVLVMDMDLRKASLSKYGDRHKYGIADYLADRIQNINDVIQPVQDAQGMYLIPVGTLPPNPTELLFSEKLPGLLDQLRKEYDYVFIDCPPVEVVADSSIIASHADSTIFVVRAGLFPLDMLDMLEGYYKDNKFPNLSIILNGTIYSEGSVVGHYGNGFGTYGYGIQYKYGKD